ncbi:DUF2306 domain-containing protein [Streptomyces sp. NPDC002073]|uniref:DUF2306 domain-containing protein n=1 Tax=Streptomyces sp. NBC_00239 TaxID=2903640 RepID=UPI002E2BE88E|nr:DUF2306 domain-containing protein [Streptomyces sp. NBC_00239]
MALATIAFLAYQLPPYLGFHTDRPRIPLRFPLHYAVLAGHVGFGTVAMVTMCLQMWPWLRREHPVAHRRIGRVYLFAGALPSAALALIMFPVTFKSGSIGVLMSAVLWSVTGVMGFVRARQRRWRDHRRYMLYSFAIMWGQVVWGFVIGMSWIWYSPWLEEVDIGYVIEASRWVGWVGNLVVVQWWLDRTPKRPARTTPAAGRPGVTPAPPVPAKART